MNSMMPMDRTAARLVAIRDFAALVGLFGTLYGWFVIGAALTA